MEATNTSSDNSPPAIEDAELERLEADLSTIEVAMERVDSGDLEGAQAQMTRLDGSTFSN